MSPITQCHARRGSRRILLAAVLTAAAIAIGGCAAFKPKTPEQTVTERAQDRWDAMRADKFAKSYELTAPSYRAVKDEKTYRAGYGPSALWVNSRVSAVKCPSADLCKVMVEVGLKNTTPIRSPAVLTTNIEESWVREDGNWYYLPALAQ